MKNVIIDTDIGSDIDDMLAFVYAARSNELNIQGVTISGGYIQERAKIARRLLDMLDLSHISIGLGEDVKLEVKTEIRGDYGVDNVYVEELSADELLRCILEKNHRENKKTTLIGIGAFTNYSQLLRFRPYMKDKIEGFHLMAGAEVGSNLEYHPSRTSHNIQMDRRAANHLFKLDLPLYLVDKHTSKKCFIPMEELLEFERGSEILKFIFPAVDWMKTSQYEVATLYDPLTVASAEKDDIIKYTPSYNTSLSSDVDSKLFLEKFRRRLYQ